MIRKWPARSPDLCPNEFFLLEHLIFFYVNRKSSKCKSFENLLSNMYPNRYLYNSKIINLLKMILAISMFFRIKCQGLNSYHIILYHKVKILNLMSGSNCYSYNIGYNLNRSPPQIWSTCFRNFFKQKFCIKNFHVV